MVEIRWHSQTKGRDHSEHKLRPTPARQSSTLPARAWGATPLGYSPTDIQSFARPHYERYFAQFAAVAKPRPRAVLRNPH